MNRPVNPARYRIDEIEEIESVDDDDDVSGFATRVEPHWYVQVNPGEVKELSAEQLRDFYRLGVIDRETYVCQPGMQAWVQVASLIGAAEQQQPADKWQVAMGPGDVRSVSLDQLDDFYRLGVVDGQTYVWQHGMDSWAQLSSLIGEEPEDSAEDTWYAAVEPGMVKQLTLEQLDDYFRCDIISEQTPIWKEGMTQWLPLATVAGIEATARAVAAPAPAARPPTPPVQVLPATSAVSAYPMPLTTSAPPLAVSIAPVPTPSVGARWLLRLAIAAAALLTLQRHDVLFSWAQASKQQGQYVALERQLLGGPPFGTPRAVEQLVASTGGELAPVRLPWLVQEVHERALHAATSARATAATPQVVAPAEPAARPATAATERAGQGKPESLAGVPGSQKSPPAPIAKTLSSMAAPKKSVAAKSTSRAVKKSAGKSKSVFGAKGDRNDPLNAAL